MTRGYTQSEFARALRQVGVRPADTVFSHSNVGLFGPCAEGPTPDAVFHTILGAFQEALGPDGVLAVPTFTYSFCKGEPFDPTRTPSTCGAFTEWLRRLPDARRSLDPIFAVSAVGPRAGDLLDDLPPECFGFGSFWDRFLQADGVVCNMNLDAGSTFLHHAERRLRVPYRYDKLFAGDLILGERRVGHGAVFFCQDLSDPTTVAAFAPFDRLARERGIVRTAVVGRGGLVAYRAADALRLLAEVLPRRPLLLTAGGEREPPGDRPACPEPPPAFDPLAPVDLVSPVATAAYGSFAQQERMLLHRYPTGAHAWSWIVPEEWSCEYARLEAPDGRVVFSTDEDPLHVARYSLPFSGEVSREELARHLHTDPADLAAVPYRALDGLPSWGLCCTERQRAALAEDRYRVEIRAAPRRGHLMVAEGVVPGGEDGWVLVAASPSGPGLPDHGMSGVRCALEVLRALRQRPPGRYAYRVVLVPERYGLPAYLSANEALLPTLRAGLWLGDLDGTGAHALQLSLAEDSEADHCFAVALRAGEPGARILPYGTQAATEVAHLNAVSVGVPMLALGVAPDSPEGNQDARPGAAELVLRMLGLFEASRTFAPTYRGALPLARAGLHHHPNPAGVRRVLDHLDGKRSAAGLAVLCELPLDEVVTVLEALQRHQLVRRVTAGPCGGPSRG
jgi:aminoglycoside 3-N-acetyltransferase